MDKNKTVQILLIEDNPGDARLVKEALREETSLAFNLLWVDRLSKGLEVLGQVNIDAVLLDLSLPDSSGLATLEKVRANAPRAPIILLTGTDDQALAARMVHEGAQDYLIKGQVDHCLLVRSIRYAIERGRLVGVLQEKEARFRRLAENAPDMIFRYEYVPRPGFTYVNPACTAITGYTPEEYYADPDLDFKIIYPDDRQLLVTVAHNNVASVAPVILRWVHKDGSLVWTEHRNVPVFDEAGNLVALEGTVRDITERKRAEKAVENSEKRFRALIENGLDNISLVDAGGVLLWESPATTRTLGYAQNQFIGQNTFELMHPDDLDRIQKLLASLLREPGSRKHGSFRMRRSDGAWRWMEGLATNLLDEPSVKAIVINYRDITERKQAEEEIRRQVAELEAVNRVSTAMRAAQSLDELLPRLIDETLAVMNTDSGMILLYDPASNLLHQGIKRGVCTQLHEVPMKPSEGIGGTVFATGEPYFTHEFGRDPLLLETARQSVPNGWGGVCVPILTANETIGVFFVSVHLPRTLLPEEAHLLQTIAEIAGNAIHRTRLNEQTITSLSHLTALRSIDMAISSGQGRDFTLDVILDQVIKQLGVDAADILLLDLHSTCLQFAAGLGFRNPDFERAQLKIGQGYAGRAVQDRALVHVANDAKFGMPREVLFAGEGFVTYYGVPLFAKNDAKGVLEIFHRTPLIPDHEWLSFLEALAGQAAIAIDNAELFEDLQRSNAELSLAYDATIEGWSRALDLRDKETEGHSRRVTDTTLSLARRLGFDEERIIYIRWGALLHDIGKMGIPERILLKPGP